MSKKRKEFPEKIKEFLRMEACEHCSICHNPTRKGEIAHIEAATEGGPRYNPDQNDEARTSSKNGIFLCCNCHNDIDSSEKDYPVEFLHKLKKEHIDETDKKLRELLKDKIKKEDFKIGILKFYSKFYIGHEKLHYVIKNTEEYYNNLKQIIKDKDDVSIQDILNLELKEKGYLSHNILIITNCKKIFS